MNVVAYAASAGRTQLKLTVAEATAAGSWHSGTNALIVASAELLLLLFLCLRWLVRRQGGWSIAWRAFRRQFGLTRRAFTEPVREYLRFRAEVRQLTGLLSSAATATVAHEALDDADAALAGSAGAFGYAVRVRPSSRRAEGEVTVHLAGRDVPRPPGPWWPDGDDRVWSASTGDVTGRAAEVVDGPQAGLPAVPRVLVPLGCDDGAMLLVDLLSGPRVLCTYGDDTAGRTFVQALAAYLDLPGGRADVMVARGVHPLYDGPDLDSLLASLEGLPPQRPRPVVVVCAAPDAAQSARLCRLAGAGLLSAVVAGQVTGHRWDVRVDSRGRIETPGLGLEAEAGPLGPAVARVVRSGGAATAARTAATVSRHKPAYPARSFPDRVAAPPRLAIPPRDPVTPQPSAWPGPAPPPPAMAELFAEPEITRVSAADARDGASSYSEPSQLGGDG
jgi:hypothetical protein